MATKVVMPKMGATMEEGTIVKWLVEVGEHLDEGDAIVEVLTDKITMEIEAEVDGVLLKTLYEADDVVNVYETICYIGQEGEVIENEEPSIKHSETDEVEKTADSSTFNNIVADDETHETKVRRSPAARKLADENNLSLHSMQGSGPKGRIQKSDVEMYLAEKANSKVTPLAKKIASLNDIDLTKVVGTGMHGKIVRDDVIGQTISEQSISEEKVERKPFRGMRRIIADRLTKSANTAPHVTLTTEVDMSEVIIMRKVLLPSIEQQVGYRLSFNEIIIKTVANTLKTHPAINISLQNDEIIYHRDINIGFAVAVPDGLVVPVVRNADERGLSTITKECKNLGSLAREGKLSPDHMSGGTFTVSNLGMYAIDAFTPIINQPESAILGVGRIVEKPVGINGEIVLRSMMTLSLSFDHRIIDGAPAAEFLTNLKDMFETPYKLII